MATTTTTSRPAAGQLLAQGPAEGWTEYGRRTMLHALQADDFGQLPNDGLAAAAEACNVAMSARDISDSTLACLTGLQRELRARLACRRADVARRLTGLQTEHDRVYGGRPADVPPAAAGNVPPAAGSDGGSKVRKPAGPRGPIPPAFQLPELDPAQAF